ncbi:MAG: tetratricopeptide repeat protein [Bacteroidota bacterium]
MNRNQIIVIAVCAVLGIGIYLFADTKKPKDEKTADSGHTTMPEKQQAEPFAIEEYIADINSRIEDKALREKIESLAASKNYKDLLSEYVKLDKPLAVAYYTIQLAEKENKAASFTSAGDYNSMLMQTAPDEKAKNFLSNNALECYQKAVALDSTNTENRLRLASAYMSGGGAPMQGVTILLDIVNKDSTNVDALLMLGRFGIISGQYDKAIGRLEKILYLHPQNSEALLLIAEAYNNQGNKSKAIEMLQRCKKSVSDPDAKKEIDKYIESIKKPNS